MGFLVQGQLCRLPSCETANWGLEVLRILRARLLSSLASSSALFSERRALRPPSGPVHALASSLGSQWKGSWEHTSLGYKSPQVCLKEEESLCVLFSPAQPCFQMLLRLSLSWSLWDLRSSEPGQGREPGTQFCSSGENQAQGLES